MYGLLNQQSVTLLSCFASGWGMMILNNQSANIRPSFLDSIFFVRSVTLKLGVLIQYLSYQLCFCLIKIFWLSPDKITKNNKNTSQRYFPFNSVREDAFWVTLCFKIYKSFLLNLFAFEKQLTWCGNWFDNLSWLLFNMIKTFVVFCCIFLYLCMFAIYVSNSLNQIVSH